MGTTEPDPEGDEPGFVDAHHHLWDLERHRYDWLSGDGWPEETEVIGEYASIRRSYRADDLLRDAAGNGLIATVHVQADWSGPDPVDETRWLQQVADTAGIPNAIVAYADVSASDIEDVLGRHLRYRNVRGIRSMPHEVLPMAPAFRRGVAAVGRAGLTYDLRASPDNAADCCSLLDALPAVTFIVGHTGEPLGRSAEHRLLWRTAMGQLAERPNVAVKSLRARHARPRLDRRVHPALGAGHHRLFGTDRCMFGTNWPVDGLYGTYGDLVRAYRQIIAPFSAGERRALLNANAQRLYRI